MKPDEYTVAKYVQAYQPKRDFFGEVDDTLKNYVERFRKFYKEIDVVADEEALKNCGERAKRSYFTAAKPAVVAVAPSSKDKLLAAETKRKTNSEKQEIRLHTKFLDHIFNHNPSGTSHAGLHSVARIAQHPATYKLDKRQDGLFGCYLAWVTVDVSKVEENSWKWSTFFPDKWDEAQVQKAIKAAYIYSKLNKSRKRRYHPDSGWRGLGRVFY